MKLLYIKLLSLVFLSLAFGGHDSPNGGDTVLCTKDPSSPFEGFYSLDYILNYEETDPPAPISSAKESLDRIYKVLQGRSKYFADSFKAYVDLLENSKDYQLPRIWIKSGHGLIDLKDEKILQMLPPNCIDKSPEGVYQLMQAVLRQQDGHIVLYSYDPTLLKRLKTEYPLQYSFLIVHEWLWDFTGDVQAIRRVNYLLHSKSVESLDSEGFARTLNGMGLKLNFLPVCYRTEAVRKLLEAHTGSPCELVTQIPAKGKSDFVLNDLKTTHLREGDFSGLGEFKTFHITDVPITFLPERIFYGMVKLALDIKGTNLEEVYERTFEGLTLGSLYLHQNKIRTLPEKVFSLANSIEYIDLNSNQLTELPVKIFREVRYLGQINLQGNQLSDLPDGIFDFQYGSKINVYLRGNKISREKEMELYKRYPFAKLHF